MSLSLQKAGGSSSVSGLLLQPTIHSRCHPSLVKNVDSLKCAVNTRVINAVDNSKQPEIKTVAPFSDASRNEKLSANIARKRDDWRNEYYSQANQYINKVTESPSFLSGLSCNIRKASAFTESTRKGYLSAFSYIAKNVNQNYYLGIFRNLLSFFSTGALNQNCVFCSKAVDMNLAELAKGKVDNFWVAKQTSQGQLPQNVVEENYNAFVMQADQSLSSQLLASTREHSRNIIMVPVKNRYFSHAMNLVRTETADLVIDGQSGRVYDLSSTKGKARFDERYGHNRALNLVQIYHTGQAPELEK